MVLNHWVCANHLKICPTAENAVNSTLGCIRNLLIEHVSYAFLGLQWQKGFLVGCFHILMPLKCNEP